MTEYQTLKQNLPWEWILPLPQIEKVKLYSDTKTADSNDFEVTDALCERPDVPILQDDIEEEAIANYKDRNLNPVEFLEPNCDNKSDFPLVDYAILTFMAKCPQNYLKKPSFTMI